MPGQFSAVVQGADGTVLVAGVSEAGVFVEPWPERSK